MKGHLHPFFLSATVTFVALTTITGVFLLSSNTYADNDSVIDRVKIKVPVSCTLSGTGMNSHNAEIINGGYQANIGTTVLHAFCNDASGFAIYAAGYTGDEIGATNSNKLVGTAASNNATIDTGLATSAGNPDVSNWAMKLAISQDSGDTTGTNAFTIDSDTEGTFSSYHTVPNEYTKVAHKDVATDMTNTTGGVKLTTTYAAYISRTQPADTYSGQVKYTLVHPSLHPVPQEGSMLITGQELSVKMKSLAAGTSKAYNDKTSDIKAIRMTDTIPAGYDPDSIPEANVVSVEGSKYPVYIFFDNTNDAGIMYFYSEGNHTVTMNPDSAYAFRSNFALTDISGLRYWDTSNVTTMQAMFVDDISLTNVNALADWDTSNVESLSATFATNASTTRDGYYSSLSDISALANWDTSRVTNMYMLFQTDANITDITPLANWDVSKVTNMSATFSGVAIQNVDALANWNVSKVETMQLMFGIGKSGYNAGIRSQLTDISALANWKDKLGNVTSMQGMFSNTNLLINFHGLENWDVSSVTIMTNMFGMGSGLSKTGDPVLDLSPISNWNVSNVTDMSIMFQNINIASFLPLSNWNVGNVQNFSNMFNQTNKSTTTTLAGLENWDVSSATNMSEMFSDSVSLTDASAINGWDIRNVVVDTSGNENNTLGFNNMFQGTPAHPTFTLRTGTWNSNGTFIPSS